MKKKLEVEALRDQLREELKTPERLKLRDARRLMDKYHHVNCAFVEGEELKNQLQESEQALQEIQNKIDTAMKYTNKART